MPVYVSEDFLQECKKHSEEFDQRMMAQQPVGETEAERQRYIERRRILLMGGLQHGD